MPTHVRRRTSNRTGHLLAMSGANTRIHSYSMVAKNVRGIQCSLSDEVRQMWHRPGTVDLFPSHSENLP